MEHYYFAMKLCERDDTETSGDQEKIDKGMSGEVDDCNSELSE